MCDMSSDFLSRPIDVSEVWPDLCRGAEERRSGRSDNRDLAGGSAGARAAGAAGHAGLQGAGGGRVDAQHPALLRDLHSRAGVEVAKP